MSKSSYGHIRKRENGTFRVYWQEYGERKNKTFNSKQDAKNFLAVKEIKNHKNNPMIDHKNFIMR